MKAVVLEIRDGYAAVLREDGTVEKIRRSCRVGETIELEETGRVLRFPAKAAKWTAAAAAAVVLLSAGGVYGFNNAYAYSYVTLDANPSIEYTLNRRNRVIAVEALNEDAAELAAALSAEVKNSTLTEAIEQTTELLYEQAYLSEGGCLLVNVTSRGQTQEIELSEELDAYFSEQEEELEVYVTNATREQRQKAGDLGVSAGRYMVIRELMERETPESEPTREDVDRLEGATVEELFRQGGPGTGQPQEDAPMEASSSEMSGASGEPADAAPGEREGTSAEEAGPMGETPFETPDEEQAFAGASEELPVTAGEEPSAEMPAAAGEAGFTPADESPAQSGQNRVDSAPGGASGEPGQ